MDQVTVVLGGGTPIGRAVVDRLLEIGSLVAVLDTDAERVARVEAAYDGDLTLAFAIDPTDPDELSEVVDAVAERFGAPTGLVLVVQAGEEPAFLEAGVEAINGVLEQGVFGALALAYLVAGLMEDGGAVVAVLPPPHGSAGPRVLPLMVHGAVTGFVRGAAVELARANVRVNGVVAGIGEAGLGPLAARQALGRVPQNRFTNADEVAATVMYLLSDSARHVTGQVLAVDGGAAAAAV